MHFNKLKEMIEDAENKMIFPHPVGFSLDDIFMIQSILYDGSIYCGNVKSIDDIYDIATRYELDPKIFSKPYYIIASFDSYIYLDENTIDVINSIDDDIYVQINIRAELELEQLQLFLRITHTKCQFELMSWIDLDCAYALASKYDISSESCPVIVINDINSDTIDKMNIINKKISNPRFRIEINDAKSLQYLGSIASSMPNVEIIVILNDELFDEKNPRNARELIIPKRLEHRNQNEKLTIQFKDMEYDSMDEIYELERNMELIKSHTPSNASELDIITYVTLFMINYFHYDYEMLDKDLSKSNSKDINLTQLIALRKGVCRHFASFTKYILNSMGVECDIVSADGNINDVESNGHAFNVVKINGKMYFLDNTWIINRFENKTIESIVESSDYLTSNEDFHHEDYVEELGKFQCETYDRKEISESIKRVLNWQRVYVIHLQALKDLFRKHMLKKDKSVADIIEDAIPGRRL